MPPPSWFENFPAETRDRREKKWKSKADNSQERVVWEIGVFLAIALGAAALIEVLLRACQIT
jgi:hypothetical protein